MRILLTANGSSHTEEALRIGAQIARRAGDPELDRTEPPTVLTVIGHEVNRPQAEEILASAREILATEVPNVRTRVRIGYPAAEIIHETEEGGYDLVIVGARQDRNLLKRLLVGSTAVRVVEHAPCPVVVAKGRAAPVQRILLCASGAEGASLLDRFAAQLPGLLDDEEEITVLHVMSQMGAGPGVRGKQLRAGAEELIQEQTPEGEFLDQDVQALKRLGLHGGAKVRHGLVVDEILAEAKRGDYDLVVIGAYRGEGWQRILLDDLAHKLIVQMDRSVLIVR